MDKVDKPTELRAPVCCIENYFNSNLPSRGDSIENVSAKITSSLTFFTG